MLFWTPYWQAADAQSRWKVRDFPSKATMQVRGHPCRHDLLQECTWQWGTPAPLRPVHLHWHCRCRSVAAPSALCLPVLMLMLAWQTHPLAFPLECWGCPAACLQQMCLQHALQLSVGQPLPHITFHSIQKTGATCRAA